MAIITISRQIGSEGETLAAMLSEKLAYARIDKQTVESYFVQHGLSQKTFEKLDERQSTFWDFFSMNQGLYKNVLAMAIYESVRKGRAVVLGRGGQILLQRVPGVLHIRVIAPREVRLKRIQERFSCDSKDAKHILQNSDHERGGYLKSFFKHDWDDPEHYDLVINTAGLSLNAVSRVVETAVSDVDGTEESATEAKITDLLISQKVIYQLLYGAKLEVRNLRVDTNRGVTSIMGVVNSEREKEECTSVARETAGVKEVVDQIVVNVRGYE